LAVVAGTLTVTFVRPSRKKKTKYQKKPKGTEKGRDGRKMSALRLPIVFPSHSLSFSLSLFNTHTVSISISISISVQSTKKTDGKKKRERRTEEKKKLTVA
jgi:hypothetical protein